MPEESIAAYINNIVTFTIFIIILASAFAILFLMSSILARRNMEEKDAGIEMGKKEIGRSDNVNVNNYKKNPYLKKNAFILGIVFINIIVFIILALAVLNYSIRPSINLNIYLIAGVLLYLILMAIYLVRSKIIN